MFLKSIDSNKSSNFNEFSSKIETIKKTIAMARLKKEFKNVTELKFNMSIKDEQIENLQQKVAQVRGSIVIHPQLTDEHKNKDQSYEQLKKELDSYKKKHLNAKSEADEIRGQFQEAQEKIIKLTDDIEDYKTDNESCLKKISILQEGNYIHFTDIEITELKKNTDKVVEDNSNFDATIDKFKEFWEFILMENQPVLNNLDKSIPNFKSLYSKLDADEKQKFKPILQIVAHSLQFLKKIKTLDESYNFLSKDYKKFVTTTNQSIDQFSDVDKNKAEMLEKQLDIMQKE